MKFKIILASVRDTLCDDVVDAAKAAGATGATIIPARGTGGQAKVSFLGLKLESLSDLIMFLVEEHLVDDILKAIKTSAKFEEPGGGMAVVIPVDRIVGMESQMKAFKERARDEYF